MMKNKATHSGHCQACGHLQKLPKGVMSLHGYNVTYGFFNGVCRGAKYLPFEQSCDLVATFIEEAKHRLEALEDFRATLRTRSTVKAWVRNYERSGKRYGCNSYIWREVALQSKTITARSGDFTYQQVFYLAPGTWREVAGDVEHKIDGHYTQTLEQIAQQYNARYADWLQSEATSLQRYIDWQTERVATWKPAELLPVETKDKEGFKPEEPAY